jgi:4-amino-4-deoxy-L-arabinose transferase-like glycosyltransferase
MMYAPAANQLGGRQRFHVPIWAWLWFAALMVLTVSVRLLDPTGWLGSDDASYYSAAEHVLTGQTIHRVHHHYARMAVVVPVAASMWLFGESPATVALPMLIASTLCVVAIVVLGRLLWGWWEGLCAATIVSVLPYFRVLSTTAFPDVHVCLWTTVAMLLAVIATRTDRTGRVRACWVACGFALGLAISAKVFAIAAGAGVLFAILTRPSKLNVGRSAALAFTALGVGLLFLVDGLFYQWAANDFFFSLHATQHAQDMAPTLVDPAGAGVTTVTTLIWDRLTMLLHPTSSGWGWIGVVFWPVVVGVLLFNAPGRALAAWAIATYLLVAVVPVSLKEGTHVYPIFHGRHILPACVPFALCLAWMVRRGAGIAMNAAWIERGWPAVLAALAALAFANPRELNGFRDRATSRIGVAVSQIAATTQWDHDRDIFMAPSLYWRFRVLFPQELRSRLRVAADGEAPRWWRDTCADITSRSAPLPPPGDAYLIATPRQLRGETEPWDYGVGLPRERLSAWQAVEPRTRMSRFADKTIRRSQPGLVGPEPFLLLLGGGPAGPDRTAKHALMLPSQLPPRPDR